MELLKEFDIIFAALVGIPALITVLINVCKQLGFIKDGIAGKVSQWANLVVYLGLFVVKTYKPDFDFGPLDEMAGVIAQFGVGIVALIPMGMFVSGKTYGAVRGMPLIGKSYDPEA